MISDYPREDNGYAKFLGQTRCIMAVNTRKQEANENHFRLAQEYQSFLLSATIR